MNWPTVRAACVLSCATLVGVFAVGAMAQDGVPVPPLAPNAQPADPSLPQVFIVPPPDAGESASDEEGRATQYASVRVSEYLTVDLFLTDVDVRYVLQQLAVQSSRNIVPSHRVRGAITASLTDAPFYEALDAILVANGFAYIERGDFIFVYTQEEVAGIDGRRNSPTTKVIRLDWLPGADAARFVRPLLSPDGRIEYTIDGGGGAGGDGGEGGGSESFAAAAGVTINQGGANDDGVYTPNHDDFAMSNTLVIYDYASNIAAAEALIDELDVRPRQVLIEATIVQAALTEANAFGVDFALLQDVQFTDFFNFGDSFKPIDFGFGVGDGGMGAGSPTTANNNFVVSNPGNTGQGPATLRLGIMDDDIGIFVRALDEVTDVSLLSNPKLMALDRQRGKVLVGTKVGYLQTVVVENQVLQTVEFIDTGIELDFRAFVNADGSVRLELKPKVSDVDFRVTEGADGITQQIPDERIQTVSTHVVVPQGATAVLGGLFREDSSLARRQVPVLGDLPILGAAFRGHDDMTMRSEVMFLVKPTVMNDAVVMDQGREALAAADRVRVGSRNGLLPWSRDRQTNQLNVEAQRLADEGKIDEALWCIRRSLELHPAQPDAIRIQESLIQRPQAWPSRSFLDRIMDEEVEQLGESNRPAPDAPDVPEAGDGAGGGS